MEEAYKWYNQAKKDLDTARFNFDGGKYEAAAFFCQQAVEKALKALYIKRFKRLLKTHDLVLLAKNLKLPKNFVDLCKELSPAYIYTRYPDAIPAEDIKEITKNFIKYSEEVLEWIKGKL